MKLIESEKDKFSEDWWLRLSPQFSESYMKKIYTELYEQARKGYKIYPSSNHIYKQFKDCSYNDTLVVFLIGEPVRHYNTSTLWRTISRWIEEECFEGLNLYLEEHPNCLLGQGIITLPVVFTASDKEDHTSLGWQVFVREVIKQLSLSLNKIIFVYEDSCMEFLDKVDPKHKLIKLESGCFTEINSFLKKEYNIKINW